MSTRLDRLLESIDPSRTIDNVSADVDRAVNTFTMRRAIIDDWNEYQNLLADFYQHIEQIVLRIPSGLIDDRGFYWTRCSNILNKNIDRI